MADKERPEKDAKEYWNQMDMTMEHRLACDFTRVHPDVESLNTRIAVLNISSKLSQ